MIQGDLVVVTAGTSAARLEQAARNWMPDQLVAVLQTEGLDTDTCPASLPPSTCLVTTLCHLGSVPAFALAMDVAIAAYPKAKYFACLHDDVFIEERAWQDQVIAHFERHPATGLLGFGGAMGLGTADIYKAPYDPMQLARHDFRSNMRDAEAHGARSLTSHQVAVLDGFSLIGRREFWLGQAWMRRPASLDRGVWEDLSARGVVHHAYDAAMGIYAKLLNWEVQYLPVACHHAGGQTAVGDETYQVWARTRHVKGDQGFWEDAHRRVYDLGWGVLPIRVESPS